jgi:hypothetical protein
MFILVPSSLVDIMEFRRVGKGEVVREG